MITIGNKEFRNIQEQVEKNKNDIASIQSEAFVLDEFGIKVVGEVESIDDLPTADEYEAAHEDWAYGDAYAVGTTSPYELYILTRPNENHDDDYWFYIGEFPAPGPTGPAGADGFSPEVSISNIEGGTRVSITDADGTNTFDVMDGSNGTNGQNGKSVLYYNNNLSTTIGAYTNITLPNANVGDIVIGLNGILGNVTSISDGVIVQTQTSIVGPRGETGATGAQGTPGYSTFFINYYLGGNIGTTATIGATTEMRVGDGVISRSGKMAEITSIYTSQVGQLVADVEIVADLNGARGPQGPQGPAGQDGTDGTDGQDGQDGITPVITAAASVTNTTGTPTVTVTKTGTDAAPTFTFAFSNLKGEPGTTTIGIQVVNSLPATGTEGIIYLVPSASASGDDNYDEYIYTNGNWELIGHTAVDLSNYIQKSLTAGLVKNDGTIDTNTYALASALSDYVLASTLSTVATSGSYTDLSNKPDLSVYELAADAFSGDYTDLTNKPDLSIYAESSDLATVATTGDYDDLLNKPTIPTVSYPVTDVQVNNTSVLDGTIAKITLPTLAAVATSGSYNDLINRPTIPTDFEIIEISDQTISGTLSAADLTKINANPEKIILHRGTVYYWLVGLGTTNIRYSATSGFTSAIVSYVILINKNTGEWGYTSKTQNIISTYVSDVQVDGSSVVNNGVASITMPTFTQQQANWNELDSTAASYIKNKPSLATVATSGRYNDLINKPTIPTVYNSTITIKKNSDDSGSYFTTNASSSKTINLGLATVAASGDYEDLSNKPTILGNYSETWLFTLEDDTDISRNVILG